MECQSKSNCKNSVYKNLKYCALHCGQKHIDKNEYFEYLTSFYKLFLNDLEDKVELEIHRQPCSSKEELDERDEDIDEYLLFIEGVKPEGVSGRLIKRLEDIEIEFSNIQFPSDDDFRYLEPEALMLLRWLGKVSFIKCVFNLGSLNINSNFYYKDCLFGNELLINPFPKVESKDYRYIKCTFAKNVSIKPSRHFSQFFCKIFEDCNFQEDVTLKGITFEEIVFDLSQPLEGVSIDHIKEHFNKVKSNFSFKKISIEKCVFKSSFKLNGFDEEYLKKLKRYVRDLDEDWLKISSLKVLDTEFNSKFELKNRVVDTLEFNNSNVSKIFDIYESKIKKTHFEKNIFYDFAGFEKVEFGVKGELNKAYTAKFIYTTFMSFSNFRQAIFHSGLDFERVNLKENPNFLKVEVSQENTNRESFRIIKHSFDSAGNKIEANRFFIQEMKKYRKDLSFLKTPFRKIIICANYIISGFGETYIRPFLILVASVWGYICLEKNRNSVYIKTVDILESTLGRYCDSIATKFDKLSQLLNEGSTNIAPFNHLIEHKQGFEFISLLFYIWFAVLIWQIIVAVKRHTQH